MLWNFVSWNVNGLRALLKKPDWEWFSRTGADIVGLQETKAMPEQLPPDIVRPEGWGAWWDSSTVKKGYSGVAVFSRREPLRAQAQLPDEAFRGEGRLLHLEFEKFHYFNGYFPNGGASVLDEAGRPTGDFKRLPYKMGFLDAFLAYAEKCRREKPVVVCGDFNIAHQPIDLSHPRENEKNTGFLPAERAWLDKFLGLGYVDTFRARHGQLKDQYTWWCYKTRSRGKNIGWRLDYFFVSEELKGNIREAWIESEVYGSDHCPVGLRLEL